MSEHNEATIPADTVTYRTPAGSLVEYFDWGSGGYSTPIRHARLLALVATERGSMLIESVDEDTKGLLAICYPSELRLTPVKKSLFRRNDDDDFGDFG